MVKNNDIYSKETKGYFLVIVDMILYGMFPVFAHYFVATMDPLLFGGVATLVGSLPLLVILKRRNKLNDLYSKKFISPLMAVVILSTFANIFFFLGTKITSGINSGLLVQLEPFYAMILGVLFLGEVVGKGQFLATLLMVVGAVIVVYKGIAGLNLGDLFILITPVFYQISHIFSKKIINKVSDVFVIPTARMLYGGVILTLLALLINPSSIMQLMVTKNIIAILFFGFILRALDFSLWYAAIKTISVSKASAILPFAAAVSFFLSIFFLKEQASMRQYFGLFFILGGLIWLSSLHFKGSNIKEE